MDFEVIYRGKVVGTTKLEGQDLGMGVATGQFIPTAQYEDIRRVFRMFADASDDTNVDRKAERFAAYESARNALGMQLRAEDGQTLETSAIHIADYSHELGSDAYEVEVHFASPEVCEMFASRVRP